MKKNYYQILGIRMNVSSDDLKKKYRQLVKETHPDTYNKDKYQSVEEATKDFCKIKEAYEILSNPRERRKYDLSLKKTPIANPLVFLEEMWLIYVQNLIEEVKNDNK